MGTTTAAAAVLQDESIKSVIERTTARGERASASQSLKLVVT